MKSQHAQIAIAALQMIDQVSVKGDEQSLMTTMAVRQMLTGIAKGQFTLTPAVPPQGQQALRAVDSKPEG